MAYWRGVLLGGTIAGVIDLAYGWGFWAIRTGTSMSRILQSVAAGLLGTSAFGGGGVTASLGLALHFGIALTIAAVYVAAARHVPVLTRHPWRMGPLYGLVVYVVMTLVVVPLSAAGSGSRDPWWIALTVLVHAVGVGLPCALAARHALTVSATDRHSSQLAAT